MKAQQIDHKWITSFAAIIAGPRTCKRPKPVPQVLVVAICVSRPISEFRERPCAQLRSQFASGDYGEVFL